MDKLKIAIDPLIRTRYGPEVLWVWRMLLAYIGFAWEEVPLSSKKYDIAYVTAVRQANRCRLCIYADLDAWAQMARHRLKSVSYQDDCAFPVYESDFNPPGQSELSDGRFVSHRDLIFDVFWLATGQEERQWPRNRHGHYDCTGTAFHREQVFLRGMASGIALHLQKSLTALGFRNSVARWPNGKRAAACVSHDVDYPEVVKTLELLRIFRRLGVHGLRAAGAVLAGRRTHWHFGSWIEMERELNVRAAFNFVSRHGSPVEYMLGRPDPFYDVQSDRFRNLFSWLSDQGCEIGLHASYRACENLETFMAEKQALELAAGTTVRGNRHHYWHLDHDAPESTLMIHEQAGLMYDTSLSHERYVGWRRGLSWPYFPFHQDQRRELRTLQIPTVWMDDQLFGYKSDNHGDRKAILRTLLDRTVEQGGCFLIDVHDYVYDDVLFPGWTATYRSLWAHLVGRGDIWVETPGRIAEHWIRRYNEIVAVSQGFGAEEFTSEKEVSPSVTAFHFSSSS